MASFLQLALLQSFSVTAVPQVGSRHIRHQIPMLYQELLVHESRSGYEGNPCSADPMNGVMSFLSLTCREELLGTRCDTWRFFLLQRQRCRNGLKVEICAPYLKSL